ncbi:MAG: CRISPR-associated protein Cas4 [Desulfobacterium sp.]|nr:CRISPR-associated protein Cas4 [Desulfobacterium sp.]
MNTAFPLKSRLLGVSGKADAMEFHRQDSANEKWMPFPVEYKRGKPKKNLSDKVQLCAQALCLEEMLDVKIEAGAIFYGKTRRRLDVLFDNDLREKTIKTARDLHEMISSGITPPPKYAKKCDTCSFISLCLPKAIEKKRASIQYRVSLDDNRYTVPAQLAGVRLTLRKYPDHLGIYHDNTLVARHVRSYDRKKDIQNPDHSKVFFDHHILTIHDGKGKNEYRRYRFHG